MQIYLARNNQQAGPYTLEQVNQMLANQQVLLTDLAWHEGMTEWKALGELTQGQLVYQPQGYVPPVPQPTSTPNFQNPSNQTNKANRAVEPELASIGSRIFAKILDLVLWLPAAIIPSFFFKPEQLTALTELQQKMQSASSSDQAVQLQSELVAMIPTEAWQAVVVYLIIMLAIQGFLLAKNGQSLGKKVAKIRIVDAETNEKVSLLRVFTLRSLIFIVLNLLFMPFITIIDHVFALGQKKQTLHDKLAKTKVIK